MEIIEAMLKRANTKLGNSTTLIREGQFCKVTGGVYTKSRCGKTVYIPSHNLSYVLVNESPLVESKPEIAKPKPTPVKPKVTPPVKKEVVKPVVAKEQESVKVDGKDTKAGSRKVPETANKTRRTRRSTVTAGKSTK